MIPFEQTESGAEHQGRWTSEAFEKAGTPTMGGIIIITAVMVSSFIMAEASVEVLLAVLVMLAFGGIGFGMTISR